MRNAILGLLFTGVACGQTSINKLYIIPTSTHSAVGEVDYWDQTQGHRIGFAAPNSVSANILFRVPPADGSAGQCLQTDGSLNLSFGSCGSLTPPVTISGSSASPILTVTQGGAGDAIRANGSLNVIGNEGVTGQLFVLGALASMSVNDRTTLTEIWDQYADAHLFRLRNSVNGDVLTVSLAGLVAGSAATFSSTSAGPIMALSQGGAGAVLSVQQNSAAIGLNLIGTSFTAVNNSLSAGSQLSIWSAGPSAALDVADSAGTHRITADQSGHVGISRASPTVTLDVGGAIGISGTTVIDGSTNATFNDVTINGTCTGCGSGAVTSFNTRTGAITLLAADVTAAVQDLTTSGTPTFSKVTASRASGTAGAFSTSFTGSGTSLTLSLLLADPFTSTPGIIFTGSGGFIGSISAGATLAFAFTGNAGTFLGGVRQTGIIQANTGFQTGASAGITGTTCSQFTGGICTAP